MEDSDHEVHSSSDEQDSCANSPIHSGDHDAEQVQVTSPPQKPQLSETLQGTYCTFTRKSCDPSSDLYFAKLFVQESV